jgi:hypothetical protein
MYMSRNVTPRLPNKVYSGELSRTCIEIRYQASPLTNEVSVFTAATEAPTRANLNCTIGESMERLSYPRRGRQGLA